MDRKIEPLEFMTDATRREKPGTRAEYGRQTLVPRLEEAYKRCQELYAAGSKNHVFFPACYTVVEVGSYMGVNAIDLAQSGFQVFCVDHWKGSGHDITSAIANYFGQRGMFKIFCENTKPELMTSIFPCIGSSETWSQVWPYQVCAVYIDAGHTKAEVLQDMDAWWRHVLPGGYLCGHDAKLFKGVYDAIHEWHGQHAGDTTVGQLIIEHEVWFIEKYVT